MLKQESLSLHPTHSAPPALWVVPCIHLLLQAAGESYGKQRQWGSIGFGLSSLPAGWLIGKTGLTSSFLVYGLVSLPLIAATSLMRYNYTAAAAAVTTAAAAPGKSSSDLQAGHATQQRQSSHPAGSAGQREQDQEQEQSARGLLRQPDVLLFLWRCLLLGLGMGVMSNYEFLWLKQLGAPEMLLGVAIAVSAMCWTGAAAEGCWGRCRRANCGCAGCVTTAKHELGSTGDYPTPLILLMSASI